MLLPSGSSTIAEKRLYPSPCHMFGIPISKSVSIAATEHKPRPRAPTTPAHRQSARRVSPSVPMWRAASLYPGLSSHRGFPRCLSSPGSNLHGRISSP